MSSHPGMHMDGLHIVTKQHLLEVIAPLMCHLGDRHWVVWSSYAAFLWPRSDEDAPRGFHERVVRLDPDVCTYTLDTAALLEFDDLMTLDWVDVIALASGTNASAWWKNSGAGRRSEFHIHYPEEKAVIANGDVYARRIDHAFWDVFCRDEKWLDLLKRRRADAPRVTFPPVTPR
jgi:hypothetical protein